MRDNNQTGLNYKAAGVDIEAGNELVRRIKPLAKRTLRQELLAGIGGFNAMFEIPLDRYKQPVLVSGTDGVGTKLKLAMQLNLHHTIGIDLVAMCVNDIVVCGAEPLFFLDYYATSRLDVEVAAKVIEGIVAGCEQAGAALVGGETAEMPGFYQTNDYDLAGFVVGIVEKNSIIDGRTVVPGDVVLGLSSSGPHSNGYSLIRKIIETKKIDLQMTVGQKPLHELLLTPTKIYVKSLLTLLKHCPIKAMAHITGGGLLENIPRVLPETLGAHLSLQAVPQLPIFPWLQTMGEISDQEMWRTFNNGVGMVIVVDEKNVDKALTTLKSLQESAFVLGEIVKSAADAPRVVIQHD